MNIIPETLESVEIISISSFYLETHTQHNTIIDAKIARLVKTMPKRSHSELCGPSESVDSIKDNGTSESSTKKKLLLSCINLVGLPIDLLLTIMTYLTFGELVSLWHTCKTLNHLRSSFFNVAPATLRVYLAKFDCIQLLRCVYLSSTATMTVRECLVSNPVLIFDMIYQRFWHERFVHDFKKFWQSLEAFHALDPWSMQLLHVPSAQELDLIELRKSHHSFILEWNSSQSNYDTTPRFSLVHDHTDDDDSDQGIYVNGFDLFASYDQDKLIRNTGVQRLVRNNIWETIISNNKAEDLILFEFDSYVILYHRHHRTIVGIYRRINNRYEWCLELVTVLDQSAVVNQIVTYLLDVPTQTLECQLRFTHAHLGTRVRSLSIFDLYNDRIAEYEDPAYTLIKKCFG